MEINDNEQRIEIYQCDDYRSEDGNPPCQLIRRKRPAIQLNHTECEACFSRDGHHCVITGLPFPEVARIIPFAWDSNVKNHLMTQQLGTHMGNYGIPISELLRKHKLGTSDKSWNMLLLSRRMKELWSKAFFGLKKLRVTTSQDIAGKEMARVTFQIVWLPRLRVNKMLGFIDLDEQDAGNRNSLLYYFEQCAASNCPSLVDPESDMQVKSGQIFHVSLEAPDAKLFGHALDIQWTLIRLAAMSGAADAVEQGLFPPVEPDLRTIAWVKEQADIRHVTLFGE